MRTGNSKDPPELPEREDHEIKLSGEDVHFSGSATDLIALKEEINV